MNDNKRKKSFWYTVAAMVLIGIYILIPVLKLAGVITDYNSSVTTFLVIAGAVIYIAGKKVDADEKKKTDDDDPSQHFN